MSSPIRGSNYDFVSGLAGLGGCLVASLFGATGGLLRTLRLADVVLGYST